MNLVLNALLSADLTDTVNVSHSFVFPWTTVNVLTSVKDRNCPRYCSCYNDDEKEFVDSEGMRTSSI